jgi:hypothetical protein
MLSLLSAAPAAAEGFFDLFLGGATFAPVSMNESYLSPQHIPVNGAYGNKNIDPNVAGGLRVGGIHKWERFSLGGAFVMDMYEAKAKFPAGVTAEQGGFVLQPGADLIAGIPLRFIRLYGGIGLCTPIMFYNYTGYDRTSNTYSPNSVGASGALGYNTFLGLRWLITNHINIFLEDRFTDLLTPLVIKNSALAGSGPQGAGYYDSSITFKSLNSNRIVAGVGFAWGS